MRLWHQCQCLFGVALTLKRSRVFDEPLSFLFLSKCCRFSVFLGTTNTYFAAFLYPISAVCKAFSAASISPTVRDCRPLFFSGTFLASCLDSCTKIGGTVSGLTKCYHKGRSRNLAMGFRQCAGSVSSTQQLISDRGRWWMVWGQMAPIWVKRPLSHFAPAKWPFCPIYDFYINIATWKKIKKSGTKFKLSFYDHWFLLQEHAITFKLGSRGVATNTLSSCTYY